MARTERYEEEALHKSGAETIRARVCRQIIRVRVIMTSANSNPAVAAATPNMMAITGFKRSWVHSHSTQNIGMAVGPEEKGKLAHGRMHSASQSAPRRAGEPSCLMEPKGFSARAALAGAKRPFFLYRAL